MAERGSFFNSVSGDRKYSAEDWAAYFASFGGRPGAGCRSRCAFDAGSILSAAGAQSFSVVLSAAGSFPQPFFHVRKENDHVPHRRTEPDLCLRRQL